MGIPVFSMISGLFMSSKWGLKPCDYGYAVQIAISNLENGL